MHTLRHYLSRFCNYGDENTALYLAAEEGRNPLPLPDPASWVHANPLAVLEARRAVDLIAEQRAQRAAVRKAEAEATSRSATIASSPQNRFAAEMRRGRITGSIPARCRPTLAARLAADATISVEAAIHILAHAPIEADLATAFPEAGPDAPTSSGFGPSFEAMPQSAAERAAADLEQFKAIARSLPIGGESDVIKVAG